MIKKAGTCHRCKQTTYYDAEHPTSERSNVGDYDYICYPCQSALMDAGRWDAWKEHNTWVEQPKNTNPKG